LNSCSNAKPASLRRCAQRAGCRCLLVAALCGTWALLAASPTLLRAQQEGSAHPGAEAPHSHAAFTPPCLLRREGIALMESAAAAVSDPEHPPVRRNLQPSPCPAFEPFIDWYARFLNGPEVKPMTSAEKAHLAARNLLDPFNALTIVGTSAIAVGSDAHSPYGPGMKGFGKDVGASYTQDMTGEFFGTFLIPAIAHQDPHYHRMPHAGIPRRIGHTLLQVVWTQGDNGRGMVNYALLCGSAADDVIGNLYLPGRATNPASGAARYGTGLALAPIDNIITEFLPDLARRIHVHDVFVRRIIDQVAKPDTATQ